MLSIDQLQAKRAEYVKGRDDLLKQAERQIAVQDGAIAAIDDLLKVLQQEDAPVIEIGSDVLETAEFILA